MNVMRPHIEILEQPAGKAIRFRYEGEKRNYATIPGVNSTPSQRTYPTIRVVGLDQSVVSMSTTVSCVMKNPPYKIHPHHVVSKDLISTNGVVSMWTSPKDVVEFQNISIHCVKKKDIQKSLNERVAAGVDPFGQGNGHIKEITWTECTAVRLCFEVNLKRSNGLWESLDPVVSDAIYDNKSFTDLMITRLNSYVGSAAGGTVLIIHAEKVMKQNIKVRFFEEAEGQVVWEAFGDFKPTNVLRQSIIILIVPPYRKQDITEPVTVKLQLQRPSDGESGLAVPFQYLPPSSLGDGTLNGDIDLVLQRKRKKFSSSGLLSHPHVAKCGCILRPIIQPDCPIHNPSALDLRTTKGNRTWSQKKTEKENVPVPPNVTVKPGPSNAPNFIVRPGVYNIPNVTARPGTCNIPNVTVKPGPPNINQHFNANEITNMSADERFSREIDEYWQSVYGKSATGAASMWPSALHSPVQNVPARINNQRFTVPCRERQDPACTAYYLPPSAAPPLMQHNIQHPEAVNNAASALPQVYNNPMCWNIPPNFPAPILQPLVAKLNEDQAVNYDYNRQDEQTVNRNQSDFDEYMRTLSDSVSSITIYDGESSPEESEKSEENNNSNTTDNLIRVCDNTIQQILEISKQQNHVKNTRT